MNELSLSDQSIIKETDKLLQMGRQTIEQAIMVGKLYLQKKEQLNHGEWVPWVEANLPIKREWASSIMKLAENEEVLNVSSNTHLTGITQALKFIRSVEKKNKPQKENHQLKVKQAAKELYIDSLLNTIKQLTEKLEYFKCENEILKANQSKSLQETTKPLWERVGQVIGCRETKAKYLIKVAKKELNIVGVTSHFDDPESINKQIYDHIVDMIT